MFRAGRGEARIPRTLDLDQRSGFRRADRACDASYEGRLIPTQASLEAAIDRPRFVGGLYFESKLLSRSMPTAAGSVQGRAAVFGRPLSNPTRTPDRVGGPRPRGGKRAVKPRQRTSLGAVGFLRAPHANRWRSLLALAT